MTLIKLCPTAIRFMNRQINHQFPCKRYFNDTVEKIWLRAMSIFQLPSVCVVLRNETYHAFKNRGFFDVRGLQSLSSAWQTL